MDVFLWRWVQLSWRLAERGMNLMDRIVETERLDELPPDDPRAGRSRGDLRRINRLMASARILANSLIETKAVTGPRRIVEIGAGDGTFLLAVTQRLLRQWSGLTVTLVDQVDIVTEKTRSAFRELGCTCECVTADVFDWMKHDDGLCHGDWVVANLFLHHFSSQTLRSLLQPIAERADFFAACETRRSRWPLSLSHLLGFIGCNAVTRHDAVLSVRAGFRDHEISASWPDHSNFRLTEGGAGLASHRFVARRN